MQTWHETVRVGNACKAEDSNKSVMAYHNRFTTTDNLITPACTHMHTHTYTHTSTHTHTHTHTHKHTHRCAPHE